MTMIEPEVMAQIRALSEQIAKLNDDMLRLSARLDTNHANLVKRVELDMTMLRDTCTRATNTVTRFEGRITDFTDEQQHFKTDFNWWVNHLDELSKRIEVGLKVALDAQSSIRSDNQSFKEWAVEKISQIGRIYRR